MRVSQRRGAKRGLPLKSDAVLAAMAPCRQACGRLSFSADFDELATTQAGVVHRNDLQDKSASFWDLYLVHQVVDTAGRVGRALRRI